MTNLRGIYAAAFISLCATAYAHPHVFINNRMIVQFDGSTLAGIAFTWTFDEMSTSLFLDDYHPQDDGSFDAKSAASLKENAFDNLVNYHYFLAFSLGGKPIAKFKVERFVPSMVDKTKLVYTFFVPLSLPAKDAEQTLRVTVYDDTYFTAFDILHLEAVSVTGDKDVAYRLAIEKTTVKATWPGQYMPDQLVIRFKGHS
jgi:ABC-type uncharacterized transport system substrate-binding protein